mmetsp:Transcript_16849/g.30106  ORF Transcript_16849/g.30106 Transcript_16849/m.30106 type:complete len:111 (+) Transcript_16849:2-334(+)
MIETDKLMKKDVKEIQKQLRWLEKDNDALVQAMQLEKENVVNVEKENTKLREQMLGLQQQMLSHQAFQMEMMQLLPSLRLQKRQREQRVSSPAAARAVSSPPMTPPWKKK